MKSPTHLILSIFVLFVLFLSACNLPMNASPTPDENLAFTQAAQTSAAQPTNTPPPIIPTVIITPIPPTLPPVVTPTSTFTPLPSPTPSVTPTAIGEACTDQIEFVTDVTIPDNTEMLIGEEFVKTWQLKNTGTCTWTSQYSLVFLDGVQMGGASPLPLTSNTTPGSIVDISVGLKAPGTTGTNRGNWMLRNQNGVNFGTGKKADQPFFVQIDVVEGVSELNLGTPTWSDPMDSDKNWYLLDTANTKFTMDDGKLVMKSITPGAGEEWGLSNQPALKDYFLEATFIMGSECSGLDRYGLLGRAPEPNKGYVYEFSCDGHYRLYKWDGTTYTALQEWYPAASIKSGTNQTNVMGLWMKGSTIKLYANSHLIGEFIDSTYDEGQFGLVVGSAKTQDFKVYVDQVRYWELE